MDVSLSGQGCVLEAVEFRSIEGPLTLPADTAYDITVRLAAEDPCTGDVAIRASGVQLRDGDNVSVTAHLNDEGSPTATVFANDLSEASGSTRISARHAADFGPVDVVVNGSPAFEEIPDARFRISRRIGRILSPAVPRPNVPILSDPAPVPPHSPEHARRARP